MKFIEKVGTFILCLFLGSFIPYGFVSHLVNVLVAHLDLSRDLFDFVTAFIHRGLQFILTLLIFKILFKDFKRLGILSIEKSKNSLSFSKLIMILWPLVIITFFTLAHGRVEGFHDYIRIDYPMRGLYPILLPLRDFLLLDALAEEVLYRGLIIAILSKVFTKKLHWNFLNISSAALISIPIFVVAHIQVDFFPFKILFYDEIQLILTLFTGYIFVKAYEDTKGLLMPILLHGYTNLIITLTAYFYIIIR